MYNSEYRIWSEDYHDYTPTFVLAQDGTILDPNNLTFMDVIGHVGKDRYSSEVATKLTEKDILQQI